MEVFLFATALRPALWHTQPLIQWLPSPTPATKRPGRGAIPPLPSTSLWLGAQWNTGTT